MAKVIAFRTDASLQIGAGHVMRCLTMADALHAQGAECVFICRPHAGHLLDLIYQRGHNAVALPILPEHARDSSTDTGHDHWLGTDWDVDAADTSKVLGAKIFDWLVVDHYALDRRWEKALRSKCYQLMVIDDLADRMHDCDLLLDQNLGRNADDYSGLIPHHATRLIGPQYSLLRPEFAQLRSASLARRVKPKLKRLLITMGGVDKDNFTSQVLSSLRNSLLPADCEIIVVMGATSPWLEDVRQQAQTMPWPTSVLVSVDNMAQLMADSDLAIGGAGTTSWERCCLGLPTAIMVLADNQRHTALFLERAQAVLSLSLGVEFQQCLAHLINEDSASEACLRRLSDYASKVTDGEGCSRVVNWLTLAEKK